MKAARPVRRGEQRKRTCIAKQRALLLPDNRRATAIKILVYDGQGFWLCQKRLSSGRFRWWPVPTSHPTSPATATLAAHQLAVLFSAGNPSRTGAAPDWRPVSTRT